jgi:hypothetical protein
MPETLLRREKEKTFLPSLTQPVPSCPLPPPFPLPPSSHAALLNNQVPSITGYTVSAAVYPRGDEADLNCPTVAVAEGTAITFSVAPALPAGLTLSTSTGGITGVAQRLYSIATHTVTVTNTDGESDTFALVVSVLAPGPVMPVIANMVVEAGSSRTVTVNFPAPDALDPFTGNGVPTVCVPASGSELPAGKTTTVVCTAKDIHGTVAAAPFQVTVLRDLRMATYDLETVVDWGSAQGVTCVPASRSKFRLATTTSVTCQGRAGTKPATFTVTPYLDPKSPLLHTYDEPATYVKNERRGGGENEISKYRDAGPRRIFILSPLVS